MLSADHLVKLLALCQWNGLGLLCSAK